MKNRVIAYLIAAIIVLGSVAFINANQWNDAYEAKPHFGGFVRMHGRLIFDPSKDYHVLIGYYGDNCIIDSPPYNSLIADDYFTVTSDVPYAISMR